MNFAWYFNGLIFHKTLNETFFFLLDNLDGYTMSDVLMYWQPTAVLGVFDTELPQFTILGYETNDRKVLTEKKQLATL